MKTTLKKLISEKKWYYVNSNIIDKYFPKPDKIETENQQLIYLDKTLPSQECLDLIKSKGCRPANCWELIIWANAYREEVQKGKWCVALGKLWQDSDGDHRVPIVRAHSDGDFDFDLGSFGDSWDEHYCLLVFRDPSLDTKILEKSFDILTIEKRLIKVEQFMIDNFKGFTTGVK